MKANELMIGDWVKTNDLYKAIKDVKVRAISQYSVEDETTNQWIECQHIEPIPLTAEILEKNGFERRKLDGGAEEFVLADDYYDITIEEWSDSIWVVRYDCTEMGTPHEQAVCSYVHQLQNFFRLSAPDELADNFKV